MRLSGKKQGMRSRPWDGPIKRCPLASLVVYGFNQDYRSKNQDYRSKTKFIGRKNQDKLCFLTDKTCFATDILGVSTENFGFCPINLVF